MKKKRIATVSLAGCFGCHTSLLDIDERMLELLKYAEFDRSPLNDLKRFTQHCDIGFVEGGCCNEENVHVLRDFRKQCDILISVGDCATMGGIPALRNTIPLKECYDEAYLNEGDDAVDRLVWTFQYLRAQVVQIGVDDFEREGLHEHTGEMSIAQIVDFLPGHLADHVAQLRAVSASSTA